MKNLLVPCDFSKPAIDAFRFALDVASLSDSTVHLLNVIELPVMPNTAFTPVRSLGMPLRKEMSANAEKNFEKLKLNYKGDKAKVISSVEFGVPSGVILAYAKKNPIDTIIMGSHGATGFKEMFAGSNTEKIVRTSPVPVIVVKDFYKGPVKDIVFACTKDCDSHADLVRELKNLQSSFGSTIHLVWINTPANFTNDSTTLRRLETFARSNKLQNYTISTFNDLYEEEGLIEFAHSINADMIAMGTHGRRGLSRMVYGSMAENVANHGKDLIWTYVMKK
jgi:nucleotide-binding universal stress UspA family protein